LASRRQGTQRQGRIDAQLLVRREELFAQLLGWAFEP
jgi:hypothetical protein